MSLFPPAIDNTYRGRASALWILGVVLLLKTIMSVNSIVNGYAVARDADGIPLDAYPPAAAQTIVALLALFGLGHLLLAALSLLALARYRSLVPFMFGILIVELVSRKTILYALPIARTGAPPASAINLAILGFLLAGLALSLWKRVDLREASQADAADAMKRVS
jgi:hypothetical protein